MDVTAAQNTPEMYTITASGTFTFDRNCRVRTTPYMDDAGVATYTAGESVNYDSKVKNDDHLWLSYLGGSGTRVYVDYANIPNNEYFGSDSNSIDPIQASSTTEPTNGEGLGTLSGQAGADRADATPDGTTYVTSGNFTYTTNGAYGRETTLMDSTGIDHIVVNSTVPYEAKVKADNHYWLKYVSSNDGKTYYVPYATIVDSTTGVLRYYGTDSKPGDPVYASGGSTSTGGGLPALSDQEGLGELTGAEGAAVASQTPDGTVLDSSGHFGIESDLTVYSEPSTNSTVVGTLAGGDNIYYEEKVKSGNYYWLIYSPNDDGHYVYVPYAQISPYVMYGEDEDPGDPVYTQGGGTQPTTGREQGGTDTGTPSLSGAQPLSSLDGYEFPMCYDEVNKCYVNMISGAATRTQPTFSSAYETGTTHKAGEKTVHYVAKTNGTEHTRMWVKFENGNYMPIGQLSALNKLVKQTRGNRHEKISTYVEDQNEFQPWEYVWPHIKTVGGTTADANWNNTGTIQNAVPSWETGESLINENPSTTFEPSELEKEQLSQFHDEVASGTHPDDVLIAYIADTHLDSYQTPATARVLHSMMLMSWYSKTYGVDLVIHGGDLNDGVKPRELSEIDVERGVDAIKMAQRPYIVLQGNHDDNSGYVRDVAGYKNDELITNAEARSLRSNPYLNPVANANDAVYGVYTVPDSNLSVIVLDGFDQPDVDVADDRNSDSDPHWDSYRHGYTRYSDAQISWLQNVALPSIPEGNKIMVFNHISLHGVSGWSHQPGSALFEDNSTNNPNGVAQSQRVYNSLVNHQAQNGDILGYICGHTHEDNNAFSGGIHFATETCGLADRGDGKNSRSIQGVENNAWTILRVSPSNNSVDQFRFGWSGDFLPSWKL